MENPLTRKLQRCQSPQSSLRMPWGQNCFWKNINMVLTFPTVLNLHRRCQSCWEGENVSAFARITAGHRCANYSLFSSSPALLAVSKQMCRCHLSLVKQSKCAWLSLDPWVCVCGMKWEVSCEVLLFHPRVSRFCPGKALCVCSSPRLD